MEHPSSFGDWIKYWFWRVFTPVQPRIRDFLTFTRLMRHEGRQEYLIGKLHPSRSIRDLVDYLISQGFANHFVAWRDSGEVVSLRRTDGFRYQYHLRIFVDNEIRCHYEYTPEYRPIKHLNQVGFEDRTQEFKNILQDWIVPPSESTPSFS